MENKLKISKNLKGEDGYKTFSIRIKDDIVGQLDQIASETNRSRNELINIMLQFAIDNVEVE
ncbi:Ribbon-helix-helix protein, CopG family [[Clostridium] methylpentosum DSM 5476]|uniref:Ribbon-helix-helix protein, CopG family n=1 Tax=[Clostridium] methylpentosum DSM 5476 TaxID=537013 RepID=C0EEH1_9FIRM|nr:Ribbon-helix-helix protein, CopG family [[Clostridium] methylpentosum DSM 5476]MDY3989289.1 ribbon-helix-helix protein, CopG family [Massilioclostridium sp.]MEE1493094.1 ribbon-helix-helix protein, CopG family [Massilioclostridium sp.]